MNEINFEDLKTRLINKDAKVKEEFFNLFPILEICQTAIPDNHLIDLISYAQDFPESLLKLKFSENEFRAKEFCKKEYNCNPKVIREIAQGLKEIYSAHLIFKEYGVSTLVLVNLLNFLPVWKKLGHSVRELLPQLIKLYIFCPLIDARYPTNLNNSNFFEDLEFLLKFIDPKDRIDFLRASPPEVSCFFLDSLLALKDYPQIQSKVLLSNRNQRMKLSTFHDLITDLVAELPDSQGKALHQKENFPQLKILDSWELKSPQMKIIWPLTESTLFRWGKELNICVNTYGPRIIRQESIVFGITFDEKIKYCVEICPRNFHLIQLKGNKNHDNAKLATEINQLLKNILIKDNSLFNT